MAIDDETFEDKEDTTTDDNQGSPTPVNPDAPDFVKDIKINKKPSKLDNVPLSMDVSYNPQNPYQMDGNSVGYKSNTDIDGLPKEASFLQTAKAEAYNFNTVAQAAHAGYEKFEEPNPAQDIAPADWTPKSDQENFLNVRPENLGYVLAATGPKDQAYRLQRVMSEQATDDALQNGSFTAKLLGGAVGMISDPMTYIPVMNGIKYAKLADSFVSGAVRSLPGVAAYSVAQAGAENLDKVKGNAQDFLTEAFTDTVFGTALFGITGGLGTSADKLALWNLRKTSSSYFDGIDYKLSTDAAGKITGYSAVDTTGSLSAAKVDFAQKLADSTFERSGLFKIPYVGSAIEKGLALKIPGTDFYFGSQLQPLLTSPYKTLRGFIDRTADHSIITEGLANGEVAPKKFASLMQQSQADFRALSTQVDALHLERNGFDIQNRALGGLVNLGLNLKNKGLSVLGKDMDKSPFVSKEDFYGEIEDVLLNNNNSQHAPVNEAARMLRTHMDDTYKNYRTAYNLPEDWLPPKTAQGYLMRVYDTPFMNANHDLWVSTISNELKNQDQTITERMQPINDLSDSIKEFEGKHTQAVGILADIKNNKKTTTTQPKQIQLGVTHSESLEPQAPTSTSELIAGSPEHSLHGMRVKLRSMKEQLQNELRSNPDLQLHVHDWNALSANEGKELKKLLTPKVNLEKQVADQKKVVSQARKKASAKLSKAKNSETIPKAIPKAKEHAQAKASVKAEETKLRDLQDQLDQENDRLQTSAHNGEINSRFYNYHSDRFHYEFKDPADRLKFRDTYGSDLERETHAKAYYDTIMNQTAEETINQTIGRFKGNSRENPIKQRTLLIPDKVLYDNHFMSKDLMAKTANYSNYLNRRTHLKSVFGDVTVDGGIDSLVNNLNNEYQNFRKPLDARKSELQNKMSNPDLSAKEKEDISKKMKDVDKQLVKETKGFDSAKKQMNHIYEKMMGMKRYSRGSEMARSLIMSLTAIANLPFVPFTQVNDLSAIGLQHGMWPFIRDGVYPVINSIAGLLKTKDSEALRKTAPSVHLALQDTLSGYADRNWGMHTNPYLNLGKWVKGAETLAHMSSNFTLTNYIDNGLQRMSAAISQSEFMRILHAFKAGDMSKKEGLYIRKYGIDPNKWADRMVTAFKQDGGGKTKLGGYQSLFHQWQDLEAANEFGSAVFRAVKDTNIQSGIADSPFWSDSILGSIIKGFNGWTYASLNRYVIPSMQMPDAQKMLGVSFMLGMGALVDPMRRFGRGEDAYPDNLSDENKMWAAINNSGYFSFFATALSDANVLSGDRLMGNLKSDKYKDRTRAGLLGPAWGTANRLADITGMMASGEWNKSDVNKAVRMLPFANATWTYWMSKKLTDTLGANLPNNRNQAHALKEMSQ